MKPRDHSRARLLFIGSLDVAPTFGGPIQFHRHFVERQDFDFRKLVEPPQARLAHLRTRSAVLTRILDRLSRSRLFPHFAALNGWLATRKAIPELIHAARAHQPDAIVSVAFGAYGFAAPAVADALEIPLLTFFHDWWPDLAVDSRLAIPFFDRQMQRLGRRSDVALCVCEEMRRELGAHPNTRVLYPISGAPGRPTLPHASRARPRVVYLGSMTRAYGRMLAALADAYQASGQARAWDLAIFGDARDWPAASTQRATDSGILRGKRTGDAASAELAAADLLIVAMDFERPSRRRVRTSFPSKLLDYCAHGKPVVAWAPDYSSLAGFAQRMQFPVCVADPSPAALLGAIGRLLGDPAGLAQQAETARELAATVFDPDRIHAELCAHVAQAIGRGTSPMRGGTLTSA